MIQVEAVLKDLRQLWQDLGSNEYNPGGVLRACALTLIVLAEDEDADPVGETLAMLMREHPSRAVVVRASEGAVEPESRVFAQCWMPFGKRQQICCEQVEIRCGVERLPEIDPLLLALAAPDLPVVLWCRGKRWLAPGPGIELFPLAQKLVFDSKGNPGALRQLASWQRRGMRVADLEWVRITPWRELVSRMFEEAVRAGRAKSICQVNIRCGVEGETPQVRYFQAWIQNALPSAEVRLQFRPEQCGLHSARFAVEDDTLEVALSGDALEVVASGRTQHNPCPERSEAELLEEELKILGPDPIYRAALQTAAAS
jgi:glucose-6-phosphate dehydrogenase assembly protein OpcA